MQITSPTCLALMSPAHSIPSAWIVNRTLLLPPMLNVSGPEETNSQPSQLVIRIHREEVRNHPARLAVTHKSCGELNHPPDLGLSGHMRS